MILKKTVSLFLLIVTCIFACQTAEDPLEPGPEPTVPVTREPEYGTISGTVTDAGTGNPIPGVTVTLLGISVETGVDGKYVFQEIVHGDAYLLTVEDSDYKPYNQSFVHDQARAVLDIELSPLKDPEAEIKEFFDGFADLIGSLDPENLDAIRSHFSEIYVAADDAATLFGVASGIIPENYEDVVPAITQLFEEYVWLEFVFRDMEMDVTHARKLAVVLRLDVNSEKFEQAGLRSLDAHCRFEFRREKSKWKIVYWQLFALDIRL